VSGAGLCIDANLHRDSPLIERSVLPTPLPSLPVPQYYDALPVDYIEPGETTIVSVDGFPVAVANIAGEYFAFQSLCPHQGTTLGGRRLEDGCFISCPGHSSRYDVRTGSCVQPATDGFSQDLMVFPTRIVDDAIQVEI